jgi:hypothetical protein
MSRIVAAVLTAVVAVGLASVPSPADARPVSSLARGGGDLPCC